MLLIYWCMCILISFKKVQGQDIEDVTLVIQKLSYGTKYNATCVVTGNAMKSAVNWINVIPSKSSTVNNYVSEYIPRRSSAYNCKINNYYENCRYYWTDSIGWKLQNSLDTKLGPVLDRRWEEFDTIHTDGSLNFKTIAKITSTKSFQFHISIRTKEAHIYLCDNEYPPKGNCYWILIGGWSGTSTAIRKCKSGLIPSAEYTYAASPCKELRDFKNHSSENLLNVARWAHFTVTRNSNNILLYNMSDPNPILNYTDATFDTKNILVTSRSSTSGFWKVHNYYYTTTDEATTTAIGEEMVMETDFLCVTFFVAMCNNCQMTIEVLYFNHSAQKYEIIKVVNIEAVKNKQWKEETIIAQLASIPTNIRLRATTVCDNCKNPFWAIDYFEMCSEKEIRVLKGTLDRVELTCQMITTAQQVAYTGSETNEPPEVTCPNGTFGKDCITCRNIFSTDKYNCDKSIICGIESSKENVCRCSMGYTGIACQQPCSVGSYGFGCKQKCGYCQYPPCESVTGSCLTGLCLYGYIGNACKIPPAPVLRYPPTILEVKHTSCIVQLKNLSYDGTQQPLLYKIQYKITTEPNWTSLHETLIYDQDPIEISNLNILTTYAIRAILLIEDHIAYEREAVPNTFITTTCKLIDENNIQVRTSNVSATIAFQTNIESCPSSQYNVKIDNQVIQSDTFSFKITNLKPTTNYNVSISNINGNVSIHLNFITEEGTPSKVEVLRTTLIDDTSITISWDPPLIPNGVIRYYEVTYKHLNYLACDQQHKIRNQDNQRTLREYSNSTVLQNLIPYSQYRIEVVPFTVLEGEHYAIVTNTRPTESPDEVEVPSIRNITPESKQVNIFYVQPNCSVIKGLLDYYVAMQCFNDWCPQSPTILNFSSISYQQPLVLTDLFPYTNYSINIKVGRRNGNIINGPGMIGMVTTTATVPNVITSIVPFSKNESSVLLRFPPPYPPTGIIAEYFVTFCYKEKSSWGRSNDKCGTSYIPAASCKLWPDLQCIALYNLNKNQYYEISIRAKNNGTNFNEPAITHAQTTQEAPGPLQNLSAVWDEHYNLTLTWFHPSIINGPLTKFIVKIFTNNGVCFDEMFPVDEDNYQLSYRYMIQIASTCYSSRLSIYAYAFNIMAGPAITLDNIFSPPSTPYFNPEPKIISVTNVTILLDLRGLFGFDNIALMYILVSTETENTNTNGEYIAEIWRKAGISEKITTWVVAEYDHNYYNASQKALTIGNGIKSQSTHLRKEINNKQLIAFTNYTITILLINEFQEMKRHKVYTLYAGTTGIKSEKLSNSANTALFALLLLILIPIAVYFVISRYKKKTIVSWGTLVTMVHTGSTSISDRSTTNPDIIPLTTDVEKKSIPSNGSHVAKAKQKTEATVVKQANTSRGNQFSKPIKIVEFENYVKESIENGELERQHHLFPRGQTKPWDYGILPQNKSKNRYNNLIAYNHTRVKLKKIGNDEFSDYINANYIEGYNTPRAYIATQGPKPATVNDFWRMIWQEKVYCIVMVANVIEGGKKKSEQYWPNVGERLAYGNIQVEYLHSQIFADFEYRTFSLQCEEEERKVEHLHFVSWPDHGVPLYCQSLVPFLRKLLTIPQGSSPVVVHCSAGVGRTGTIILADICLRMAAREGVVDVLKHQHNLREQRANLVDNIEQYKLAHLVLLECLIAPQTNIACDETIESSITKLLESNSLQHHMQYLKDTDWQDHAMQPPISITANTLWAPKNRFQEIIPSGFGRVYISRYPVTDEHSDYINAVEVDGFRAPQRFIATQQPLPHTVCDFWRMVDEKEVSTIISLNVLDKKDTTSCIFWPTENVGEIKPVPYITLRFHNKSKNEDYSVVTIHLLNSKNKKSHKRTIHLIYLKGWSPNNLVPDNQELLLKLWEETERLARGNSNPIVVTCHNGVTACGLYLSLIFVIEKINLEQQCDVCLAVRTIRHNRKQFVTEKEQFVFLYHAALLYLTRFNIYSNFSLAPSSVKN